LRLLRRCTDPKKSDAGGNWLHGARPGWGEGLERPHEESKFARSVNATATLIQTTARNPFRVSSTDPLSKSRLVTIIPRTNPDERSSDIRACISE